MGDTTDPGKMDMIDRVGADRSPNEGKDDKVRKWVGFGLGIWTVVILVAIVFVAAILIVAL